MAEKRKDNKNRNLNIGESQRKDGKYEFKYTDVAGNRKSVYSWRLVPTDKTPKGKKFDLSLREKEQEIQKELDLGIIDKGTTVVELLGKYISLKDGVRRNTKASYETVKTIVEKYSFSVIPISKVKQSVAKIWIKQLKSDGKSYNTIKSIYALLKSAFKMAITDDELVKNPFDFRLADVIQNDSKPREALTENEKQKLLQFLANDKIYKKHYDAIYIMLNSGLRISEFCGLTFNDIDFNKKRIKVSHQLLRKSDSLYYIEKTKSRAGCREIVMTDEVADAFHRLIDTRMNINNEPVIDGYSGFLTLTKTGKPKVSCDYESAVRGAVNKYNRTHIDQLPRITPHVFRHTFCTEMMNKNINPKSLQYIMGHSDISMTLNRYAHINADSAADDFRKIMAVPQDKNE